jgi:hypothetical protein
VQGSIPKDEELRATKAGCTVKEMRRIWPVIERHFHAHKSDRNLLVNDQVDAFRNSFLDYVSTQKTNAKRGGDAKQARKTSDISKMSSGGSAQYNTTNINNISNTTNDDGQPPSSPSPPKARDWPETAAAIREYFPRADDELVRLVVAPTMRVYEAAVEQKKAPPLTDSTVGEAVHQAYFDGQTSAGLFLTTVPQVVKSWIEDAIRDGSIH